PIPTSNPIPISTSNPIPIPTSNPTPISTSTHILFHFFLREGRHGHHCRQHCQGGKWQNRAQRQRHMLLPDSRGNRHPYPIASTDDHRREAHFVPLSVAELRRQALPHHLQLSGREVWPAAITRRRRQPDSGGDLLSLPRPRRKLCLDEDQVLHQERKEALRLQGL